MEDKCVYLSKKLSVAGKKWGMAIILPICIYIASLLGRAENGLRTISLYQCTWKIW